MWIWPSDRVVLDSACSPSVLLERIGARAAPRPFLDSSPSSNDWDYEGWVGDETFRIRPAWPGRRHSFRVYVEGRVEPHGAGSRLRATIHLDGGAMVFFVVLALLIAGVAWVRPLILDVDRPTLTFWLIYAVGVALAWLGLMTAFWAGLGGARSFLAAVAADPTDPSRK